MHLLTNLPEYDSDLPITVGVDHVLAHPAWRDARAQVLAAILAGARIVLLAGLPGTGKTLLLEDLARTLRAGGRGVFLCARGDALEASAAETVDGTGGECYPAEPHPCHPVPQRVVLVDEAGRLPEGGLERLGQLGAASVVLAGLPDVVGSYAAGVPDAVTVVLRPLAPDEVPAYVAARLEQAGKAANLFSAEATERLAELAGGAPRLLNMLAATAAFLAGLDGAKQIAGAHVKEAAAFRGRDTAPEAPAGVAPRQTIPLDALTAEPEMLPTPEATVAAVPGVAVRPPPGPQGFAQGASRRTLTLPRIAVGAVAVMAAACLAYVATWDIPWRGPADAMLPPAPAALAEVPAPALPQAALPSTSLPNTPLPGAPIPGAASGEQASLGVGSASESAALGAPRASLRPETQPDASPPQAGPQPAVAGAAPPNGASDAESKRQEPGRAEEPAEAQAPDAPLPAPRAQDAAAIPPDPASESGADAARPGTVSAAAADGPSSDAPSDARDRASAKQAVPPASVAAAVLPVAALPRIALLYPSRAGAADAAHAAAMASALRAAGYAVRAPVAGAVESGGPAVRYFFAEDAATAAAVAGAAGLAGAAVPALAGPWPPFPGTIQIMLPLQPREAERSAAPRPRRRQP